MVRDDDPRLTEARAIPIDEIAERLSIAGLKRAGRELVGPCPACGGKDRFGINIQKGVYNCRHCGAGDGLKLVQLVLGCDFKAALAWLIGEEVSIDPAEAQRRATKRAEDKRRSDERAAKERAKAIARAKAIWAEGGAADQSPVAEYLKRRGMPALITASLPDCLRYHPSLSYMVDGDEPGQFVEIHRGPAMLAACVTPSGEITAVHRTWIDLDQPKGKARIVHKGEVLSAKKIWGHKKGCAIRLSAGTAAQTLIMGEGIETTLTALAADVYSNASYWAGIDLGNMSGSRLLRGAGMKYAGIPDLDDQDAFIPPPWVKHLIFIQDGDSEPKSTRAKLLSGLRRARAKVAAVERISIINCALGVDLNDVLMGALPLDFNPYGQEFLDSPQWGRVRQQTLNRYGRECMSCGWTPGHKSKGPKRFIQVDHIKPRSRYPHLALDPDNLQVLCSECNKAKSDKYETDFRKAT